MAMTFSAESFSELGTYTATVTCNTSSAAGTFYPGFSPTLVEVIDTGNVKRWIWQKGMADASSWLSSAAANAYDAADGITVTEPTDATPGRVAVTLGTDLHTNSAVMYVRASR